MVSKTEGSSRADELEAWEGNAHFLFSWLEQLVGTGTGAFGNKDLTGTVAPVTCWQARAHGKKVLVRKALFPHFHLFLRFLVPLYYL